MGPVTTHYCTGTLLQAKAAISYQDTTQIWTLIDAVIHLALSWEGAQTQAISIKSGRDHVLQYHIFRATVKTHKNLCSS